MQNLTLLLLHHTSLNLIKVCVLVFVCVLICSEINNQLPIFGHAKEDFNALLLEHHNNTWASVEYLTVRVNGFNKVAALDSWGPL